MSRESLENGRRILVVVGGVHSIIVVVVDGPETSISPSSLMNTPTHEKTLEKEMSFIYYKVGW